MLPNKRKPDHIRTGSFSTAHTTNLHLTITKVMTARTGINRCCTEHIQKKKKKKKKQQTNRALTPCRGKKQIRIM